MTIEPNATSPRQQPPTKALSVATGTSARDLFIQPAVTIGFGCAAATWVAWLLLASPVLSLAPTGIGLGVLGVWMLASAWSGRYLADRSWASAALTGMAAGLVTAAVGVLVLGSKLVEPASDDIQQGVGTPHPQAIWAVLGFFVAGGLIGGVGAVIGRAGKAAPSAGPLGWLARMTVVSAVATFPLLLLGGAVTSTESGLAVTGWPDTFGANMFLYPISLMSHPRVFMEHTHRLFGAMVGLTILTQWVMAMFTIRRGMAESIVGVIAGLGLMGAALAAGGGMKLGLAGGAASVLAVVWMITALMRTNLAAAAGALFLLVVAQGIMGGTRVTESSTGLAILHGVAGQVLVALAATLALVASDHYQRAHGLGRSPFRSGVVLALVMFLQVAFGAAYRHLRREDSPGASHALMSHIALSIVVVILASVVGGLLAGRKDDRANRPRGAVKVGKGLGHVVGLQFILGWLAFGAIHAADARTGVPTADELATAPAVPWWEALIATVHQANGALLGVMIAMALAWAWRLKRPGAQ